MQGRSDFASLEREIPAVEQGRAHYDAQAEVLEKGADRQKFKASTLTHIANLRPLGQDIIENQYIERVCREQSDYAYEKYAIQRSKEHRDRQRLIAAQMLSKSKSSAPAPDPMLSDIASVRYSQPRPKMNFVREKMVQIGKIDRGLETTFTQQAAQQWQYA